MQPLNLSYIDIPQQPQNKKNEEKNNIIEIKATLRSTKNRINVTKKKDKDYTNSPSKVGAFGISQSYVLSQD